MSFTAFSVSLTVFSIVVVFLFASLFGCASSHKSNPQPANLFNEGDIVELKIPLSNPVRGLVRSKFYVWSRWEYTVLIPTADGVKSEHFRESELSLFQASEAEISQ